MQLLIYGSREFAATVMELARHCGHDVAGVVDDFSTASGILGTFESVTRTHPPDRFGIALAIGYKNLGARWSAWERIRTAGYPAPALVHPRSYVADTARIEDGAMVMAGAVVDVRATVGEASVVWPGATLNHDAVLGPNSFLSPNATVCGFASIGRHCFVGAGAVVVDHVRLPEGGFVKAGSVYSEGYAR